MSRIRLPGTAMAVLATALAAPAALGQPAAPTPPRPNAGSAPAPPLEIGRPQRTHGGWRSSRIVGAIVYNDHDERIGTVDDLVIRQDGRISEAVLSVGGFLHIGAKLVAVPYDRLRFEESTEDQAADVGAPPAARIASPAASAAPAAAPPPARPVVTTRLVLPGATRDSLAALPSFSYRERD
jgi:PRC-barrel domain